MVILVYACLTISGGGGAATGAGVGGADGVGVSASDSVGIVAVGARLGLCRVRDIRRGGAG